MTETVAQEAKSKGQLILEKKKKQIQDPRSIVILISQSGLPRELVFSIFELDKKVNSIMRNVGFTIPLEEAKKKIEDVRKMIVSLWNKLKEAVPEYFLFSPERWNELNEPYEQKQILINRRNTIVFIPRSNEGAQIMMAFKILSRKRIDFSREGNLVGVEKIAKIYLEFGKQIKELNELLSIKRSDGDTNG